GVAGLALGRDEDEQQVGGGRELPGPGRPVEVPRREPSQPDPDLGPVRERAGRRRAETVVQQADQARLRQDDQAQHQDQAPEHDVGDQPYAFHSRSYLRRLRKAPSSFRATSSPDPVSSAMTRPAAEMQGPHGAARAASASPPRAAFRPRIATAGWDSARSPPHPQRKAVSPRRSRAATATEAGARNSSVLA